MTTLLVTGAGGFLGGRLAVLAAARGHRVRALVRSPQAPEHLVGQPGVEVVVADLLDRRALDPLLRGVDQVFHCAGNIRTWDRWERYRRDNVEATRSLVDACLAVTPELERFVHVSSVDVYGFPEEPASEEHPTRLDTFLYGKSKILGETEARRLADHGIAVTVVRPGNIVGPRSPLVERCCLQLRSRIMTTVDQGRAHAGLVHVDNLVENMLLAAESPRAVGETYNLRDDGELDWRGLLDHLADGIGAPRCRLDLSFSVAWALARTLEAPHRWLGLASEPLFHPLLVCIFGRTCGHPATRAREHFGATSTTPLDEALASSIAWFNRGGRTS